MEVTFANVSTAGLATGRLAAKNLVVTIWNVMSLDIALLEMEFHFAFAMKVMLEMDLLVEMVKRGSSLCSSMVRLNPCGECDQLVVHLDLA